MRPPYWFNLDNVFWVVMLLMGAFVVYNTIVGLAAWEIP